MSLWLARLAGRGHRSSWALYLPDERNPAYYLLATRAEQLRDLLSEFNVAALKKARKQGQTLLHKNTAAARKRLVPANKVRLLSPVTSAAQIICQGKNYTDHIKETGWKPSDKDFNMIFRKASSALTGPAGAVLRPPGVRLLDYELELGLIIKKTIDRPIEITEENLSNYIIGLVQTNDVSARDIQVPQEQWHKGKSFRTFCPVGPHIQLVDAALLKKLPELELELRVNGDLRQSASVAQMLYQPAATLNELSRVMDLHPGDLVMTGTPAGVALQAPPAWKTKLARLLLSPPQLYAKFIAGQAASGRYLKDGDQVTSSIRTADGRLDLGQQHWRVQAL